jgi:hypothetical protein
MNRKASKNGCSIGGDPISRHTAPTQSGQPEGAGKDLVAKLLTDLDRSYQEQGSEMFRSAMISPTLYFRALVALAKVQARASSKLSDLERQRIRTEALLRLQQR